MCYVGQNVKTSFLQFFFLKNNQSNYNNKQGKKLLLKDKNFRNKADFLDITIHK